MHGVHAAAVRFCLARLEGGDRVSQLLGSRAESKGAVMSLCDGRAGVESDQIFLNGIPFRNMEVLEVVYLGFCESLSKRLSNS